MTHKKYKQCKICHSIVKFTASCPFLYTIVVAIMIDKSHHELFVAQMACSSGSWKCTL